MAHFRIRISRAFVLLVNLLMGVVKVQQVHLRVFLAVLEALLHHLTIFLAEMGELVALEMEFLVILPVWILSCLGREKMWILNAAVGLVESKVLDFQLVVEERVMRVNAASAVNWKLL